MNAPGNSVTTEKLLYGLIGKINESPHEKTAAATKTNNGPISKGKDPFLRVYGTNQAIPKNKKIMTEGGATVDAPLILTRSGKLVIGRRKTPKNQTKRKKISTGLLSHNENK